MNKYCGRMNMFKVRQSEKNDESKGEHFITRYKKLLFLKKS